MLDVFIFGTSCFQPVYLNQNFTLTMHFDKETIYFTFLVKLIIFQ